MSISNQLEAFYEKLERVLSSRSEHLLTQQMPLLTQMARQINDDILARKALRRRVAILRDAEGQEIMDRVSSARTQLSSVTQHQSAPSSSSSSSSTTTQLGSSTMAHGPKQRASMWGVRSRVQTVDPEDTSAIREIEQAVDVKAHMRMSSAGYTKPPNAKPRRMGGSGLQPVRLPIVKTSKKRPVFGVDQPPKSHTKQTDNKADFTRSAHK